MTFEYIPIKAPMSFCCMSLLRAVGKGVLEERAGGIFLCPHQEGCVIDFPIIEFCPFCGKKWEKTNEN